MEDFLVYRDPWLAVSRSKPYGMKDVEWEVLERKVRSLIKICLANLVLLKIFEVPTTTSPWKKLGYLC